MLRRMRVVFAVAVASDATANEAIATPSDAAAPCRAMLQHSQQLSTADEKEWRQHRCDELMIRGRGSMAITLVNDGVDETDLAPGGDHAPDDPNAWCRKLLQLMDSVVGHSLADAEDQFVQANCSERMLREIGEARVLVS